MAKAKGNKAAPEAKALKPRSLSERIGKANGNQAGGSIKKAPTGGSKLNSSKSSGFLADAIRKSGQKGGVPVGPKSLSKQPLLNTLRAIQNKNDKLSSKSKPASTQKHAGVPTGPSKGNSSSRQVEKNGSRQTEKVGSRQTTKDRSNNKKSGGPPKGPASMISPEEDSQDSASFNFKHASLPPVLRLGNLANGTSAADVRTVLSQIGKVLDCRVRLEADKSVTAETVFESPDHASIAVARFHNSVADGRTLSAVITKSSSIAGANRISRQSNYVERWVGPPLYSDTVRGRTN